MSTGQGFARLEAQINISPPPERRKLSIRRLTLPKSRYSQTCSSYEAPSRTSNRYTVLPFSLLPSNIHLFKMLFVKSSLAPAYLGAELAFAMTAKPLPEPRVARYDEPPYNSTDSLTKRTGTEVHAYPYSRDCTGELYIWNGGTDMYSLWWEEDHYCSFDLYANSLTCDDDDQFWSINPPNGDASVGPCYPAGEHPINPGPWKSFKADCQ
ncbi:uncharacterized protein BCR38DRAFT_418998 [Pseudomassariella vexata]|uniref:Uncharacterized protein n=1 Tax=Pseudomassariella vexata TaxID=1141098 RepID=A0A1Y2EKQ7_9PEZI|nr:uncharacterized protein BCR38DRAFT_418998 [Pseudomassariella vexata]ORY72127.1 hypothetical protein BCR38DRAFT_418998 [Pseudomassariella vexata]